ncbi:hypothetical protein NE237_006205 [Protea cynaroides]|uniref:DUF7950 domain-containing protein n=1 Tax=Protea cynaroides TaxID=273540 RepID=A0A9Q0KM39_9MAGN|nr:hypothetical protein NE237_006205 [Protea cynaroides]
MDSRGGCCIARYAGGAYDKSKVDRIMLRYRPIAPKPAVGGSIAGNSTPETGRTKRRYVRDNRKRCNRKKRLFSEVTLLPLLPEMPDRKVTPTRNSPPSDLDLKVETSGPIWLNFKEPTTVLMPQPVKPVGSVVTVERVTEAFEDGDQGLGYTDEERKKNLERDTCPGFISDGMNRVEWINEGYKKMMIGDDVDEMVWLVMKERLPVTYPAFACRVRLQYTCRKEKHSLTVPCDVWRMDRGGFAWRLDVKAALSLGR